MGKIATIGVLDGVHYGHRYLLSQLCDKASETELRPLVITFKDHPLSVICPEKKPALLTTPEEKTSIIKLLMPMIEVITLPFDKNIRLTSGKQFLIWLKEKYDVRALLCGFNNHIGYDRLCGDKLAEAAAEVGIAIRFAKEFPDKKISSTIIRNAIAKGDITEANTLLGYNYSIKGKVVTGRQLGRRIGFPTANISPDTSKLIPNIGVYACYAEVSGSTYGAMANIGHRPTVDDPDSPITIEVNLINAPEGLSIYGNTVKITFIARLRSEMKFDSIEELASQLHKDQNAALAALGK